MEKQRILLVEDNPDDEALTLRALRKNNFASDVVIARDGQQALDYLFGQGAHTGRDIFDTPQLVLLDLKLPKIDGIEVLRRIRSADHTRLLPVVALTSSDEDRDVIETYSLAVNSYVRKPVDFQRFLEAVYQLGLYWLVLNVSPQGRN